MPDTRSHRGPDPEDGKLFAPGELPGLRSATADLSWLLSRGYAVASAVELVGNRYALTRRQRVAVGRCSCSDEALRSRTQRQVDPSALSGEELWLDGYNVLIAVEAALAGAIILRGRDGCYRDLAAIYARYHKVQETLPALRLIGALTAEWGARVCRWSLDRPVSNSGRLKQTLLELANEAGWRWDVELVFNPDKVLAESEHIAATSDSVILDRCRRWIDLSRLVIGRGAPAARVIDLCPAPG